MKRLLVIRHGKSDWGNPFQDDFDRPLNHRGLLDAKNMGDHLLSSGYLPNHIVCSTAKRAITTAYILAKQLDFKQDFIEQQKKIYLAPLNDLIATVQQINDDYNNVYIIGHNPGLTSLVSHFTNDWMELKTCCVAILEAHVASWQHWTKDIAHLSNHISPKAI